MALKSTIKNKFIFTSTIIAKNNCIYAVVPYKREAGARKIGRGHFLTFLFLKYSVL